MIRALDRKLVRDLWRLRMQAVAIALVVATGVALFVAMLTTYRSMRLSEHQYYTDFRFAQVWSDLSRAPQSITRDIAAIPGVAVVEGRIKQQAILDVPGLDQPASAQIFSIPPRSGHALDDLYVRRGRHVESGRPGEVLVSEAFAEANHLSLGDTMIAVVAGRRVLLRFVGVALSPEHVMPIPPTGLAPDDRRYAVLWMAHDELAALVDLRGAINEVSLSLAPGADEHAVVATVDRILQPYGGRGAYGRDSHPSHTMLEEHILPLRSLAVVMPSIFLLVAAFLVNIVLSRIVATQREQIGLLKAFGYGSPRVALHYLELTLLVVLPGVVLGLPLGAWLGRFFADFYAKFFRFPVLVFRVEPAVVVSASVVAVGFAVIGALGTVRRVVGMPPVVAMSPEIPAFHRSLLDALGLSRLVSTSSRMILRNVTRRPLRTGLAIAGMSLAVAVTMIGNSVADAGNRMRDVRFQAEEREDMMIALLHPRAIGTIRDIRSLPGVLRAEPFRIVPARVLASSGRHDVVLLGLPEDGVLRNAVDTAYRRVPIPKEGAVVTTWLADRFALRRGDPISLEIRENRRRIVTVTVVDVVAEPLGATVYMDLRSLGRLLGEPETYSGANLTVDEAHARELYAVLKRTPLAIAVGLRRGGLAAYRAMSDGVMEFVRKIDIVFAVIIAFGVVYNSAKIALAERGRELATLRVLGFTRAEVSAILLGEIAILALPAVPIGFVVGYWLSGVIGAAASRDRMHFPHLVQPSTYAFALVVFVVAALASALIVRGGLDRLDLVSVLKARE